MATKRKGKTIPCEGCRERKKKCSAGLPCDRCRKLNIECHYLKEVDPPKPSNLQEIGSHKLEMHVQMMQDCMDNMEQELQALQTPVSSLYNHSGSLTVPSNWKLTIKKGELSIDTNIKSYAALLDQIRSLGAFLSPTLIKQPMFTLFAKDTGYLKRQILNAVIRRGHLRATLECVKNVDKRKALPSPTVYPSALSFINAYFSCRFPVNVTSHKKTFYDMFVYPYSDPELSPVVCSLSSVILTKHCKHLISLVPHDQQLALAEFYFNKARQSIAACFDEPSIETMVTYTYMARYMANLLRPQEASNYLELAVRMHQILADTDYRTPPNSTENNSKSSVPYILEYEMFKRHYASILEVTRALQFIRNQRGVPLNKHRSSSQAPRLDSIVGNLSQHLSYEPTPMPDEPLATVRAIKKDIYMRRMGHIVGPFFYRVRWSEDDMVPTSLLIETEEQLRQFYCCQIPLEFQLTSSIFEDGLTDAEFRRRLNQDSRVDLASISLAIMYYQSLIALYEPFLPTIPHALNDILSIQDEDTTKGVAQTKRKLSPTSSQSLASEGSETSLSVYSVRAQVSTHHNAIIVVRLFEYLYTVLEACNVPISSLLCAWDILMRNSCLGMSAEEEEGGEAYGISDYFTKKDIQLAREYAVRSIEVLRRGFMFNGAERGLWEYYERIEKQLLDALCQTASPTAKYWEPVSCW